jgi:putative membrane protein
MKLATQIAAFGFLIYAVAAAPLTHALKPVQPAAAAVPRSFQEEERLAAAQEGLSDQDKSFLMSAAQGEMLQLELSRVAITRAKLASVRRFAGQTAQFIGRAKLQLEKVADEFGVSLPKIVPDQVHVARTDLTSSRNLDRDYLLRIMTDAVAATHLYKDESGNGKNPVVAQYAREMLPRLTQHYRNALHLSATLNAPVANAKHESNVQRKS